MVHEGIANYSSDEQIRQYLSSLAENMKAEPEADQQTKLPDMEYDQDHGSYEGPDNFIKNRAGVF